MTLTKYPVSSHHIAAVRASGFDMSDANTRHPVRNEKAEKVLAARQRQRQDPSLQQRAEQLLKGRVGPVLDRALGRVLIPAMLAMGMLNVAPALACGDHPTACPDIPMIAEHPLTASPPALDPAWIALGLTGLLGLALVGLRSRRQRVS